jgi:hypothetical protein
MGIIRVIFELLVLYLVYKLIFDFIIPVYRTTKQVNKKMGEMQSKMNDHFNQQSAGSGGQSQANTPTEKAAKPAKEDYIEFEEVK